MENLFGIHPIEKDESTFIPDFPTENMTLNDVASTLRNCHDMTTSQLMDMIRRNYIIFLDEKYLTDYNYRKAVIDVFSNEEFILALSNVLSTELLTDNQITCCNKVTWDYMSQSRNDSNENIRKALMKLSGTVNRPIVTVLSAYVPAQIAQVLALARYSSFKLEKNIDRANYTIIKYLKGATVQQIVNIYGVIFRTTKLSYVFDCIMFDTQTDGFNVEERERYGLISTAILEILEHGMSSPDIHVIIKHFLDHYNFEANVVGSVKPIRFSLWSINPTDYPRINAVLKDFNESIP